jgi:hypothetical protein
VSSHQAAGSGSGPVGPVDGDLLLVRASRAADGALLPHGRSTWAVVEWGHFCLTSPALTDLPLADARIQARLAASKRARVAWDSSGPRLARLPRVPLVFATAAGTFTLSLDVPEPDDPRQTVRWRSESHLTEAQVRGRLAEEGFAEDVVALLVDAARRRATRY